MVVVIPDPRQITTKSAKKHALLEFKGDVKLKGPSWKLILRL